MHAVASTVDGKPHPRFGPALRALAEDELVGRVGHQAEPDTQSRRLCEGMMAHAVVGDGDPELAGCQLRAEVNLPRRAAVSVSDDIGDGFGDRETYGIEGFSAEAGRPRRPL